MSEIKIKSMSHFCISNRIDDEKRNSELKAPEGILRFDNISYGDNERNLLDVYRPKNLDGYLPVIVSVHGGGWVYGDKDLMQFYCLNLAEKGFAVVNFSYRLAPMYKHPAALEDVNKVFNWVMENADVYRFDTNNVFAVGDSVGATMLSWYCCLCTDSDYAKQMNIYPPENFVPRAVALNCGIYRFKHGENHELIDSLAQNYLPEAGTEQEYEEITLGKHVNGNFPASFVMSALGDFLNGQSKPFCELLHSRGVEAQYHFYGDSESPLKHVFHVDLRLPQALKCNEDECEFFKKHIRDQKVFTGVDCV